MNHSSARLDFLDGMRGWGAWVVFHFHLGSFLFRRGKFDFFDSLFYQTPLQMLADGELAIFLFFVLSGFSLSYKFFKNQGDMQYLREAALFRYFRLFVPVFFAVLLPYFLIPYQGMFNTMALQDIYGQAFSFADMLHYVFLDLPFQYWSNHAIYGLVFWTLYLEFTASLGIFAFLAILGKRKLRFLVYPLLAVVLYRLPSHQGLYFLFFAGVFICDLFCAYQRRIYRRRARHPERVFLREGSPEPWQRLYQCQEILRAKRRALDNVLHTNILALTTCLLFISLYYYSIVKGHTLIFKNSHYDLAILLLLLTLGLPAFQRFFSSKISLFLGQISFSLYLIHLPILCSFSCFIFQFLKNKGYALLPTAFITLCLTELVVISLAYVFSLLVEQRVLPMIKLFLKELLCRMKSLFLTNILLKHPRVNGN